MSLGPLCPSSQHRSVDIGYALLLQRLICGMNHDVRAIDDVVFQRCVSTVADAQGPFVDDKISGVAHVAKFAVEADGQRMIIVRQGRLPRALTLSMVRADRSASPEDDRGHERFKDCMGYAEQGLRHIPEATGSSVPQRSI